jgi:hypothetical protein
MPKGQKSHITPEQDEVIRKCWEHNAYGHHAAKRAAQLTGLAPWIAHRRAMELGLVFTRERFRWTEPELKMVEQHASLSLEAIQRKLRLISPPGVRRTRAAIAGQIHAQRFRTNLDGLKHGPLAGALGISIDRLHRFRELKLLEGQRLESIAQVCGYRNDIADEHQHWFYSNDAIVRLLFAARGELDLRKVNQTWLMGLLEAYITLFQPAPKDLRSAERERSKQAKRRARKLRRKRTTSTDTPLPLPSLGDPVLDAIRAGKKVLARGRRSTGALACLPPVTATGENSRPNGSGGANSKSGNGVATSPSASPSSGCAGDPSAG